ncbi:MAG: DUF389 domain-containing protein [Rikenellaceae bacterium]
MESNDKRVDDEQGDVVTPMLKRMEAEDEANERVVEPRGGALWSRMTYFLRRLFVRYLHFRIDKEHENFIVREIVSGVAFRGAQTWVLIFAIFIASLGLNINSTAVIIGAMLISPLMGPIMGIGLGLGINDFSLIKRAASNWAAATLFAIIASTVYFSLSPIGEASSELLARTTPTIYDLLIALFGGMSGIVAASTRQRGNVIPGVAIATALMPPLCTVGYGIATLNTGYAIGAFQLYFINSVFIALSTSFGAKFLRFSQKEQLNAKKAKQVRNVVALLLFATVVPSVYVTYYMIRESYYEASAKRFINVQFNTAHTQILDHKIYTDENKQRIIEVKLIGQRIPADSILSAQMRLSDAGLVGVQLRVMQGYQNEGADIKSIGNEMFGNVYKENQRQIEEQRGEIDRLNRLVDGQNILDRESRQIASEMSVLFPNIRKVAISRVVENDIKQDRIDTVYIAILSTSPAPTSSERELLDSWMSRRLSVDDVRIIIDVNEPKLVTGTFSSTLPAPASPSIRLDRSKLDSTVMK